MKPVHFLIALAVYLVSALVITSYFHYIKRLVYETNQKDPDQEITMIHRICNLITFIPTVNSAIALFILFHSGYILCRSLIVSMRNRIGNVMIEKSLEITRERIEKKNKKSEKLGVLNVEIDKSKHPQVGAFVILETGLKAKILQHLTQNIYKVEIWS